MKRSCLLIIFITLFTCTHAQEEDANTTPYFRTAYCRAKMYTWEGHVYAGLQIKLNLLTNEIKFVKDNSDEIALTISFHVKKIEFGDCDRNLPPAVFKSGFPKLNQRQTLETYYQVLDSGKVQLLKYTRVLEGKGNGPGSPAVAFNTNSEKTNNGTSNTEWEQVPVYYLFNAKGELTEIQKSADAILKAFNDQRAAVENFISSNKIRLRKEEDLVKVVNFYNHL